MLLGILLLVVRIDIDSGAAIVSVPLIFIGLGIGALASQLGAVTVSSVPTGQSGEVGGLQNTATNLGASLGTALAGSILITVLTTSLIAGMQHNPQIPADVKSQAGVTLASGAPFLSDAALTKSLTDAHVAADTTASIVEENRGARVTAMDVSLSVLALLALTSLLFSGRLPDSQPEGDLPEPQPEGGEVAQLATSE